MDDDESRWPRQLVMAMAALLAVALMVGGVIGLVALGAVNIVGLGSGGSGVAAEPTLYIPPSTPRPSPAGEPASPSATPSPVTGEPSEKPKEKKRRKPRPRMTLSASPTAAPAYSRIYLTGTYRGAEGATLRVQRFDGGWDDFPVTVTVQGGRFQTYVESGRVGASRFRVIDPATGRASKPVTVILS